MDRYDKLINSIHNILADRMDTPKSKITNISILDPMFVDFKLHGKFYYAPLSRNTETDAIIIGKIELVDTGE